MMLQVEGSHLNFPLWSLFVLTCVSGFIAMAMNFSSTTCGDLLPRSRPARSAWRLYDIRPHVGAPEVEHKREPLLHWS